MAQRYQERHFPEQGQYPRDEQYRSQPETDPLAELARLIGQTDTFANVSRETRREPSFIPARPGYDEQSYSDVRDDYASGDASAADLDVPEEAPRPSWMKHVASVEDVTPEPEAAPEIKPVHPLRRHLATPTIQEQAYQPKPEPEPIQPTVSYSGYQQAHAAPVPEAYPEVAPVLQQDYQPRDLDPDRYDDALFGKMPAPPLQSDYTQQEQAYEQDYDDDYEEEPKRRSGLKTVAMVMALAVVGTGGAFAYRTFTGPSRSGEPPIIRADKSPNKVIPQTTTAETKQVQDRIEIGKERIVSREEQPVRVEDNVVAPRQVFPPPHQTASQQPVSGLTQTDVASGEPRRIRTVPVRGDQTEASTPAAHQAPARITAPATPAPAPARVAAAPATAPAASAPMSITPAASRPTTTASLPQSGGYVVQVASQRSESDAQASFRQIKSKYSAVLGSHSATIRRADLGDRGTYYRAMVGPFGSQEEASRLCSSLKSAGGQCVVQRN